MRGEAWACPTGRGVQPGWADAGDAGCVAAPLLQQTRAAEQAGTSAVNIRPDGISRCTVSPKMGSVESAVSGRREARAGLLATCKRPPVPAPGVSAAGRGREGGKEGHTKGALDPGLQGTRRGPGPALQRPGVWSLVGPAPARPAPLRRGAVTQGRCQFRGCRGSAGRLKFPHLRPDASEPGPHPSQWPGGDLHRALAATESGGSQPGAGPRRLSGRAPIHEPRV